MLAIKVLVTVPAMWPNRTKWELRSAIKSAGFNRSVKD